jgi:putative membrane protein
VTNRTLQQAMIDPQAVRYNILCPAAFLTATIVGIPLLLVYIPVASWYWQRYYARLRVILTTRDLLVHRGIFIREEKSIPLEKITDLAVYQGPIMRFFGLKGIRVETAGQSSAAGRALVQIVGLFNIDEFRDRVLAQRDRITDGDAFHARPPTEAPSDGTMLAVLEDIRDTLRRIEGGFAAEERRSTDRS